MAYRPRAVDVKEVRRKTGLSQRRFAATFGISVNTLRHWEHGDRKPQGPALVLLNAADEDPGGLLEILTRSGRVQSADNDITKAREEERA
ncbi:helix-turn-helix domain-containing protein [Geoalkalibacter halelectricus]|uniref:helix-turn-helix domain-containing protein n=1 Tax=Geoalkalibacter halelectricus TaxID=2847045 RepID=UPI003D212F80